MTDADNTEAINEGLTSKKYTPFLERHTSTENLKVTPPCIYAEPVLDYFRNATVRQQLHISDKAAPWDLCANGPNDTPPGLFNYTSSQNATQWIYPILKGRYKMLKFSGDTDGAVGTYGTLQWINELNWKITEAWRPYYIQNMYGQQVAGYVEVREGGFTFASVHGSGHMCPQFRPQQTYHAVFNFINGVPL